MRVRPLRGRAGCGPAKGETADGPVLPERELMRANEPIPGTATNGDDASRSGGSGAAHTGTGAEAVASKRSRPAGDSSAPHE